MTITNVVICAVMMGPFLYLLGILFSPAPVDSGDYNFANKEIRQSGYIDTTVMYALQVAAIALFATWGYLYGLSSIWHWYRLARSYKRCNTRGSRNQANLE
jgi:hypothetical protein